jgi:membrane-associated phospholipid phosphatase
MGGVRTLGVLIAACLCVTAPTVSAQQQSSTGDLQTAEAAPEPRRTGVRALVEATGRDFATLPRRQSTWVILLIGGGAAALAHPVDDSVNSGLAGSRSAEHFFALGGWAGKGWVQFGAAASLYVSGRWLLPQHEPATDKARHLGFDLFRAQILSQTIARGIRYSVRRERPTGECCSFPSGHAVNAFAAASVLERHFGFRAAWPTLALAGYVGVSRLHENRHFLSDVLFGAAVGTSIGWTVVGRHGRSDYAVMPVPVPGGMAVMLTRIR